MFPPISTSNVSSKFSLCGEMDGLLGSLMSTIVIITPVNRPATDSVNKVAVVPDVFEWHFEFSSCSYTLRIKDDGGREGSNFFILFLHSIHIFISFCINFSISFFVCPIFSSHHSNDRR
jgi:hypothetical protein